MSTNISKQKREELIGKIRAIRSHIAKAEQDENSGSLLGYLAELEKEIKGKKYGLVFEEHREGIDEIMATHTPVLNEQKELFIDNGGQLNFLIEGDNLPALQLLLKTHRERIDFIYIDPPYNTGNKDDFYYDDKMVDTNDLFRHSKWLSFMSKRLEIARTLLTENGIIFISIGEQELSNLNNICESIFGVDNFLTIISRISKTASDKGTHFAPSCDYIVCYSKNKSLIDTSNFYDEVNEDLYTKEEVDGRRYRDDVALFQSSLDSRPNQRYYIECPNGSFVIPPGNVYPEIAQDGSKIKPESNNDKVWRWSQESYLRDKHLLVFKETKTSPLIDQNGNKAKYNIYTKSYLEIRAAKGVKPRNFLTDKKFLNRRGADYLKTLDLDFSYSKPKELIEHFLKISHIKDNAIVLDFFAGSGTTGEAVLDMPKEKNLSFILCTNNENNICRDITHQRMSRLIKGYTNSKQKAFAPIKASLKYYKVDFEPIDDKMYYEYADELLKHTRELVELENGVNFIGNAKIAIVLTDDEFNGFISNIRNCTECKKLYLGHNVLLNGEQEQLLKAKKIKVNIIPDYYYKELHG